MQETTFTAKIEDYFLHKIALGVEQQLLKDELESIKNIKPILHPDTISHILVKINQVDTFTEDYKKEEIERDYQARFEYLRKPIYFLASFMGFIYSIIISSTILSFIGFFNIFKSIKYYFLPAEHLFYLLAFVLILILDLNYYRFRLYKYDNIFFLLNVCCEFKFKKYLKKHNVQAKKIIIWVVIGVLSFAIGILFTHLFVLNIYFKALLIFIMGIYSWVIIRTMFVFTYSLNKNWKNDFDKSSYCARHWEMKNYTRLYPDFTLADIPKYEYPKPLYLSNDDINPSVKAFFEALYAKMPDYEKFINPPCASSQMADLEKKAGVAIPTSFKDFYNVTNGFDLLHSYQAIGSIDDIVRVQNERLPLLYEYSADLPTENKEDIYKFLPFYFSEGYRGIETLCLLPINNQEIGQIIMIGDIGFYICYDSFDNFLDKITKELNENILDLYYASSFIEKNGEKLERFFTRCY